MDENASLRTLPEYDQPYIRKNKSITNIVVFCTTSGGVFGLLAFAAHPKSYQIAGFFGMIIAWFMGLMVGFCSSVLVIPFLRSRDLARAKPIIIWPTGIVILAMVAYGGVPAIFATPLPFLFFVCVARWVLPRVNDDPNSCTRCGYDIRESMAFGRCPECGRGLAQDSPTFSFQSNASKGILENSVRRTELLLLRRPSILLLLLFLAIMIPFVATTARRDIRESRFIANIRSVGPNGTVDFGRAAPFRWDRVLFFGPYDDLKTPTAVDAASWEKMKSHLRYVIFVDEGQLLLVFLEGNEVVEHFMFGREVDLWDTLYNKAVSRENAKFRIIQANESKHFTLVPLESQSGEEPGQ